jgi:hypothetical protein
MEHRKGQRLASASGGRDLASQPLPSRSRPTPSLCAAPASDDSPPDYLPTQPLTTPEPAVTPETWLDASVSRYGIRHGRVARIGIGRHRTFRTPETASMPLLVL